MFVDLDWSLNASSLLSASAELLVLHPCRIPIESTGSPSSRDVNKARHYETEAETKGIETKAETET